MEEIKPKKERKFLKAMGEVALTLVRELLLNVGKKLINKSGNKRQSLVLAFIILASTFVIAQYPTTTNKQRLGFQTSGDGLVFRGRASDTTALKPSTINNAYHLFDTLNNVLFSYIKTKGGWKFNNSDTVIIQGVTMPFDSITFNTAKDGTVGVGEVEYNDTQGSLIQGLKGGLVTNVIGQQLHQRVNNRTGATLTKGTAVYLSGSQGNRITVAKALGVTDAFSANTFGIVAENILHNQSGYVITEGIIKDINTSALVEDSAVYLSPTVAGGLTSTKPQAPQHTVYIGICVTSSAGSGELFVKIRNGQELDELHDVRITSPVDRASLYYRGGLWRDTTAALLTSDTASMLSPYFRDADTTSLNLTSRFAAKLNISDTASMLTNYLRTGIAASTYQAKLNGTGFVKASGTTISYDNSTYLTTSTAASTYLPLTGGTLTGALNGTTGTFTSGIKAGNITPVGSPVLYAGISGIENEVHIYQGTGYENSPTTLRLTNNNGSFYQNGLFLKSIMDRGLDEYYAHLGIMNNNFITFRSNSRIGIFQSSPSYTLDVNGTFAASGNSLIGGTLGVTGATTLTGGINGNIKTNGAAGATATPDNIWLGNSYSNGTTRDKLKIYLYNVGTEKYGFGVGGAGDIQYHSNITHDFYIANTKKFFISNTNTTTDNIFTVNNAAVFNEGSAIADFRVESDNNANMLFVDGTNNRVGIGTNAPTKTLDVVGTLNTTGDITENGLNVLTSADTASLSTRINNKVSLSGDEYINGQKTFGSLIIPTNGMQLTATGSNSNKLIGINVGSLVGEVTLGTGLSLTSNVLNANEKFYFDLGIVAGAADNSASTYDFSYGNNIFIVPTSLNGYCIDSVYIRAIGCSTCPPVAGDKDYYVGVYKANAGARVTISGASLQGSQITMNEYDLNEVNTNYTLSTGEAWWVYLNGTYTSDMAYITAGFIVKKTCN